MRPLVPNGEPTRPLKWPPVGGIPRKRGDMPAESDEQRGWTAVDWSWKVLGPSLLWRSCESVASGSQGAAFHKYDLRGCKIPSDTWVGRMPFASQCGLPWAFTDHPFTCNVRDSAPRGPISAIHGTYWLPAIHHPCWRPPICLVLSQALASKQWIDRGSYFTHSNSEYTFSSSANWDKLSGGKGVARPWRLSYGHRVVKACSSAGKQMTAISKEQGLEVNIQGAGSVQGSTQLLGFTVA